MEKDDQGLSPNSSPPPMGNSSSNLSIEPEKAPSLSNQPGSTRKWGLFLVILLAIVVVGLVFLVLGQNSNQDFSGGENYSEEAGEQAVLKPDASSVSETKTISPKQYEIAGQGFFEDEIVYVGNLADFNISSVNREVFSEMMGDSHKPYTHYSFVSGDNSSFSLSLLDVGKFMAANYSADESESELNKLFRKRLLDFVDLVKNYQTVPTFHHLLPTEQTIVLTPLPPINAAEGTRGQPFYFQQLETEEIVGMSYITFFAQDATVPNRLVYVFQGVSKETLESGQEGFFINLTHYALPLSAPLQSIYQQAQNSAADNLSLLIESFIKAGQNDDEIKMVGQRLDRLVASISLK